MFRKTGRYWAGIGFFVSLGLFLSGCVGAARFTQEPVATETKVPTPFPTIPPTPTPTPTRTPTPRPTATPTLIPTPTHEPGTLLVATPELGKVIQVAEGGYSFRQPIGYRVEVEKNQASIVNEQSGMVISLIGIKTQKHGPVESVLERLVKEIEKSFQNLTVADPYSTPINGSEGLAVPVLGSHAEEKLSGLVSVNSVSDEQLFYIIALVPDGPEGPAWNVAGRPVLETLIGSIEFFPPVAAGQ